MASPEPDHVNYADPAATCWAPSDVGADFPLKCFTTATPAKTTNMATILSESNFSRYIERAQQYGHQRIYISVNRNQ